MANNSNQVQKSLGEQMADLLRRNPKNFDVLFHVGPGKVKVEAVKFILKAASPVFEQEFEENWENGVATDDNGIPLPDIDPTVFQLFVNLLILDSWSVDSVKSLKLSPNNLLNLLGLCRRYKITKAIENLEEAAEALIQCFHEYKDTTQFLGISRDNLETIFSFEKLPLDETEIFNCSCRAGNRCTIEGLEPTGENYREVLGASLFQIRFPTMSVEEFTKVGLLKKNVLKAEEKLDVYEYIGLDSDEKANYDETRLPFNTNRRMAVKSNGNRSDKAPPQNTMNPIEVNTSFLSECFVLSLLSKFKLTTSPSFVCDGSQHIIHFQVSQYISLHGFGFLGPIDEDAHFDVTVQFKRYVSPSFTFDSGTLKKSIFARKGEIFHFLLEEPIEVQCSAYDSSWNTHYAICFSLKGKNNTSQFKVNNARNDSLTAPGVQLLKFHLSSSWNYENPLVNLLFKKI